MKIARDLCWQAGMTVPPEASKHPTRSQFPPSLCCASSCNAGWQIKSDLSPSEQEYLEGYHKLVAQYSRSAGVNLAEDAAPPKDLLIEAPPIGLPAPVVLPLPF